MKVKELIEALQKQNPEARVQMGYDGNFVSTQPTGEVFEVTSVDELLYARPGDVFIAGK